MKDNVYDWKYYFFKIKYNLGVTWSYAFTLNFESVPQGSKFSKPVFPK